MDEIGQGLKAIAALDPLGIALVIILVLAIGAVCALAIAWKRGYFRSHTDLARRSAELARDIATVQRDVHQLQSDWRTLEGRLDVFAIDQARWQPTLEEGRRVADDIQRTLRRLTSEVARLGGVTSALLTMVQPSTPHGGNQALGVLEETPDPERRK